MRTEEQLAAEAIKCETDLEREEFVKSLKPAEAIRLYEYLEEIYVSKFEAIREILREFGNVISEAFSPFLK